MPPKTSPASASAPVPTPTTNSKWLRLMVVVVLLAISVPVFDKYFAGGVNIYNTQNLQGQVIIVTGANTGIGYETGLELVRMNATVIFAGRDKSRVQSAVDKVNEIHSTSGSTGKAVPMILDLASLEGVRAFATSFLAQYSRLDSLILNAGVMVPPLTFTDAGFELQMATNHFGHFLLTRLLLDTMKSTAAETKDVRVTVVSSRASERATLDLTDLNWKTREYGRMSSYEQSKLANVLFASELAHRLEGTGITAYSLHPGVIRTELTRHIPYVDYIIPFISPLVEVLFKNPWEGAQTQLYTALAPLSVLTNGAYYADCEVKVNPNPLAADKKLAADLWSISETSVGL